MEAISVPLWMVIGFMMLAFLSNVVSFSTAYWNVFEDNEHWGLWQKCPGTGACIAMPSELVSDVMMTGRVLLVVSLVACVSCMVLVSLYVIWKRDHRVITGAICTGFLTLFTVLLGAMLWASATNTSLAWCYYLSYFSGVCMAVAASVLIHVRRVELFPKLADGQGNA